MRISPSAGCLAVLAFAACGGEPDGEDASRPATPRPEPVVVYAAHDDPTWWPGVFERFTRDTGIRVTVRHRDAATIVNEVIRDHGTPPADVLLTPSVYGAFRAADEGALRPLRSEVVETRVAPALRDPDGFWAAARTRYAVIAHASDLEDVPAVTEFEALAGADYAGQLCLATSSLPLNRVLLATLVDAHGAREAELTVRRWMKNLAVPPFDDETTLRDAIRDGTCRLGILSSDAAVGLNVINATAGNALVVDIDGIGIARHAREPEAALQLIEWLLAYEDDGPTLTSVVHPVANAAWRIDDAIGLAERAGYY